jgi:S-(hydroxymethyl)glutathione dehydrogenase / alcohol dehydrogenase
MVRAAVFTETGQDKVELRDDVDVLAPARDEVKVRIRATGVCHSDLSALNGTLPQPPPCVLGHEAAGEIIELGEGVEGLAEGDRIIVLPVPPCRSCPSCLKGADYLCLTYVISAMASPRFRVGDTPYFGMAGSGTFAEYVTIPTAAVVKMPDDVPFEIGALMGCGVMTGVGSVVNVAQVRPGDSVAVIGCGGVGISVLQAARISGAAQILAVDMVERKLDWARQFGATHAVTPDAVEGMKQELTAGEGFDHVFEVVGLAPTIRSAYDLTRRGGKTILVGVGGSDTQVSFTPLELFLSDRQILPSVFGRTKGRADYERLIALWRSGSLDLESMISARMPLEGVNDAFEAMRAGEVIRTVLNFD